MRNEETKKGEWGRSFEACVLIKTMRKEENKKRKASDKEVSESKHINFSGRKLKEVKYLAGQILMQEAKDRKKFETESEAECLFGKWEM